jgi:hypothetical protein
LAISRPTPPVAPVITAKLRGCCELGLMGKWLLLGRKLAGSVLRGAAER